MARASRYRGQLRDEIRGLFLKSATRLKRQMAKVSRPGPVFFVTLTYLDFVEDFAVWKRHLHRWLMALEWRYKSGEPAGFWRLQLKGAPHFHLLLWIEGVETGELLLWARERWLKAIGQDSPEMREHAVRVDAVGDLFNSQFYLSLHHSTNAQDRTDISTGAVVGCDSTGSFGDRGFRGERESGLRGLSLRRLLRRCFVSRNVARIGAALIGVSFAGRRSSGCKRWCRLVGTMARIVDRVGHGAEVGRFSSVKLTVGGLGRTEKKKAGKT